VLSSRRHDLTGVPGVRYESDRNVDQRSLRNLSESDAANTAPGLSLTIHNAAAAEHGTDVGLFWFIPEWPRGWAIRVFVQYRHVHVQRIRERVQESVPKAAAAGLTMAEG